ncbi:hypothetical protein POJ06DRAFT_72216 [Lipomyces tetrasporus]|uniref:5'-3' DNA helicase ZGRF1-like N-terminal domain-containing protein n=1 Tax=Lipomyces tetrasporus TaxID=54092 RepID=A0AAD7QUT5_9ASCO|nr:uncharacterized protein POJ06DRAFT_72216 [Lipomyces tetrasporus]KAJ8101854.1 hypothetical protein POJ06DRAFT_72216 [Lipomyces tetrasporus]
MNADVHVYDILWTPQVTQKSKTWYDGTLKLHTFNKRAMLYDTSRILIDSMFLSKGVLHLGETLVMERHLVTIENQASTYTVDVTPVTRTPGSNRKKNDSCLTLRQRTSKSELYTDSPASACRLSGLRAEAVGSIGRAPLSSNSSTTSVPKDGLIPRENPILKCDAVLSPISTTPVFPSSKRLQGHSSMVAAKSPLPERRISESLDVRSPRVVGSMMGNQSLPQLDAVSPPKLRPSSNKVNTPYRLPTTILVPKSPNIGILPPASRSRNAVYSNGMMGPVNGNSRRGSIISGVDTNRQKACTGSLLTPPDTSSPVKLSSSVLSDHDNYEDHHPEGDTVENWLTNSLSSNVNATAVRGFQQSSKLLPQLRTDVETKPQRGRLNSQLGRAIAARTVSRSVDSQLDTKSDSRGITNSKLPCYQSNQPKKEFRTRHSPSEQDANNGIREDPDENNGQNDDDEFGCVSFDMLGSSHSSSSESRGPQGPDDHPTQSGRPVVGAYTLEKAELMLTQAEPIKRKLLSVPQKSTRRKVVR